MVNTVKWKPYDQYWSLLKYSIWFLTIITENIESKYWLMLHYRFDLNQDTLYT